MHDCVRRWHALTGGKLLRLVTGTQMTLIACFSERSTPLWLAKLSRHEASHALLRQEHAALQYLRPWAARLGIPECWDWAETRQGLCLLQQGLAGEVPGGFRPEEPILRQALDWLQRFQRIVPPIKPATFSELILRDWKRSLQDPDPFGLAHRLLDWLRHQPAPALPACASHGDFWHGNLLFAPGKIHVVDWPCMATRPPLDDLLTLLLKAETRPSLSGRGDLDSFLKVWHEPWIVACWRQRIAQLDWTPAAARLGFYLYLARRIRWESGLEGQFRSPAERLATNMRWSAIVHWLAQRRFPAPFSIVHKLAA